MRVSCALLIVLMLALPAAAQPATLQDAIAGITPQLITWRRDLHQHPELGNREFRTAKLVADHLRALGMEVRTEVAHTGVVAVLRGALPGPVVALRADMDALPVVEAVDLPFKSTVTTQYNGQEVGVMHACGHDNHVAILMAVAQILAAQRDTLQGTVKFLFQPAEEGAPAGERGGAELLVEEGALRDPAPEAIFGLHAMPLPLGTLGVREGGIMASSDRFTLRIVGRQTHGAMPWAGVDPIVAAAQVVLGLQTVVSRQVDATLTPSVITVGSIHGGVRNNIIPDAVDMEGTVRTFNPDIRLDIHKRMARTAELIAASSGATAEMNIVLGNGVTFNDAALTRRIMPSLAKVRSGKLITVVPQTTAEDFSVYQQHVPGVFFFLGVAPDDPAKIHPNHSPMFFADERALPIGVEALLTVTLDYLGSAQ